MEFVNKEYNHDECPVCKLRSTSKYFAPYTIERGDITIVSIPCTYTVGCDPGTDGWSYDLLRDINGNLWYHIPFGNWCLVLSSMHIEDSARPGNKRLGMFEEPDSIEV